MTSQYKVMYGCDCCIHAKSMHSSLLTHCVCRLNHLKYISHNAQNIRSGEISSNIFTTYKNSVQPHGCNIYNTAADMTTSTVFPCNSKYHGITYWKCVLRYCDKCPSIVLPSQKEIKDTTNTCPTIIFHIYRNF